MYKLLRITITVFHIISILFFCITNVVFGADDAQVDPGQITFREPVQMQNESIDPFTGHLNLSYTDLLLPGDGELDLSIIRTYKSRRITDLTIVKDTILGYGWDIHFGRIKKSTTSATIELQDGTESTAVQESLGSETYVTKDFWKLTIPLGGIPILRLTDGTKITFERLPSAWDDRYYATKIQKNNNEINISYASVGTIYNALQTVSFTTNGIVKTINFNYGATGQHLSSITWGPPTDVKTIQFTYTGDGRGLASLTMPEGDKWEYTYIDQTLNTRLAFILKTQTS